MKVLHILNELKHSGAEVQLRMACKRFRSRGIEPHILSTGTEIGEYATLLRDAGYIIHHIPFRKRPDFFIDLLRLLAREKFNAVHVQTERAFIWYVFLAKIAGVRTIVRTFRSVFMFSHYLRWKRGVQRKTSKHLFGAVHTAISESVLAIEKDLFDNDCMLLRNWTDTETFRPPSHQQRVAVRRLYGLGADDFSIVCVGGCTPLKNHRAIFAAAKRLNGLLNRGKLVVLHVGAGPSLEEEKSYANQNGIEKYCRFLGLLEDIRPCLYAADAFVMTSQWEGLGMAAVEAMATGLPAILYDTYGLRDLLQDGKGGILVEPDEDCLVGALLKLSKDPESRQRFGQQAREKIVNNYSLERSVDQLIHLYTMDDCPNPK